MKAETLRDLCRKEPFVPFRIRTSDGKSYEVLSAEMIFLTHGEVMVTKPPRSGTTLSVADITGVEPIAPKRPGARSTGNKRKKRAR